VHKLAEAAVAEVVEATWVGGSAEATWVAGLAEATWVVALAEAASAALAEIASLV
jgi:hypothetical protein